MPVSYDPLKRSETLRERGLDFERADAIFAGPTYTIADRRRDYGEDRFITFGGRRLHLEGEAGVVQAKLLERVGRQAVVSLRVALPI